MYVLQEMLGFLEESEVLDKAHGEWAVASQVSSCKLHSSVYREKPERKEGH